MLCLTTPLDADGGPDLSAMAAVARAIVPYPVPGHVSRADRAPRILALVAARGTPSAPLLLAALAEDYLETHNTLERDVITYGGATDPVWRWARHGTEADILRRQPVLVAAVGGAQRVRADGVREVAAFDERAFALYERCSTAWRTSAVRSAQTLAWRFPGECVRLVVEDGASALAGLAVACERDGRLDIEDWLVPDTEADARTALLHTLCAIARERGLESVRAALPPWSPDFRAFQTEGFRVRASPDFLLARSAHAKLDLWWLREHWWLQPFDLAGPGRARSRRS